LDTSCPAEESCGLPLLVVDVSCEATGRSLQDLLKIASKLTPRVCIVTGGSPSGCCVDVMQELMPPHRTQGVCLTRRRAMQPLQLTILTLSCGLGWMLGPSERVWGSSGSLVLPLRLHGSKVSGMVHLHKV
jgi:hypothetical protein